MVVVLDSVHFVTDLHSSVESSVFPTTMAVALLLVPVGYAALRYGLSGSAATALWAVLLWLPDLAMSRGRGHPANDVVELGLVVAVALFVGVHVERQHLERARAEAAELRYRRLFDTNAAPILLVDPLGVVVEVNPAAAALGVAALGAGTDALLGVKNEDLVDGLPPRVVLLKGRGDDERDYRLAVSCLEDGGEGALRQVVLEDVTEEQRSGREARAWARELLRAQEEERRRIAQEIHDDPLQQLIQLARRMEEMASPPCSEEEAERLGTARREILGVVERLRNAIRGLRPPGLEQLGLVAALRGLLAEIEDSDGLSAELEVTPQVVRAAPEAELGVFRIVQEAVRNVTRHAYANRLSVTLTHAEGVMRVLVTDDGRGFEQVGPAPGASHVGLLGMRERASLLGGRCEVRSTPGHGTVVEATVPLG